MNIHFGFSYIGLIFLLMLMLPNIIWSKNKPKGYDKYVKNENKVLLLLEWLGEMLVTCLSLIFSDFNINKISNWSSILLIAFIIMILYEIYWIRYFKSDGHRNAIIYMSYTDEGQNFLDDDFCFCGLIDPFI